MNTKTLNKIGAILLCIAIAGFTFWQISKILRKRKSVIGESNYSVAEYSTYPELTGNPIADMAILNQAGLKYDHS